MRNFSVVSAHKTTPGIIRVLLDSPELSLSGLICPGHVSVVTGTAPYEFAASHGVPCVISGFEPLDILQGLHMCIQQLEEGRVEVENQYSRCVRRDGNAPAQQLIREIFKIVPRKWRGVGEIPQSGLGLREAYQEFDAEERFGLAQMVAEESSECIAGLVLRGIKKPNECEAFGTRCTPERPLGAPMVSSEGSCAAYYSYRQRVASPALKPVRSGE